MIMIFYRFFQLPWVNPTNLLVSCYWHGLPDCAPISCLLQLHGQSSYQPHPVIRKDPGLGIPTSGWQCKGVCDPFPSKRGQSAENYFKRLNYLNSLKIVSRVNRAHEKGLIQGLLKCSKKQPESQPAPYPCPPLPSQLSLMETLLWSGVTKKTWLPLPSAVNQGSSPFTLLGGTCH